jgi:hypothetical protein
VTKDPPNLKAAQVHDRGSGIPLLQNWAAYTATHESVFGIGICCPILYTAEKAAKTLLLYDAWRCPKLWYTLTAAQNYGTP